MIISVVEVDKKLCCGCAACASICPEKCIEMRPNEEGFLYPSVDEEKCIHCNLCNESCEVLSGSESAEKPVLTLAAVNKNKEDRMRSSSGGIFSLLARAVLEEGGVVYGAALASDCKTVHHVRVESIDDLPNIMGSKYVQSVIGDTYRKARSDLKKGKKVLFSGTPCQINGLRLFLRRSYDNLLTVDVICHGVPSPLLWKSYVAYIEKQSGAQIQYVDFRYKHPSLKPYGIRRVFEKEKEIVIQSGSDPFMRFFLGNYCLRESCYRCSAKTFRLSDITLGDFWGIENVVPELDDGCGTSLVLVRTRTGEDYLEKIGASITAYPVSYEAGVKENYPEYRSVDRPFVREHFFEKLKTKGFEGVVQKYFPAPTWKQRVVRKLRSAIKLVTRDCRKK